MRLRHAFPAIVLLLFAFAPPAAARSLYWESLTSEAVLDRDGVLSVAETQVYIFDGDWNGGERKFNVRHGQSLQVLGVERIDGGNVIELVNGDLSQVDHYAMTEDNVLRWRSRLPTDPPFQSARLTYRIRYALRGVLRGRGRDYRLSHDFAFPDREGVIRHFTLRLETDRAWGGIEPVLTADVRDLQPGRGYAVNRKLTWRGPGTPRAATTLGNPKVGWSLAAFLVLGVVVLGARFVSHEKMRGRFGGFTPTSMIDAAWLEQNVFSLPAEAVGAAWDRKVGASEVAAAIASLAQEKKIETSVEPRKVRRPKLSMKLLVERDTLSGYRRELVNKLFFNRRTQTDTEAVQKHYASSGLDLAEILREPLEERLRELVPGWKDQFRVVNWKLTIGLVIAALAAMIVTALRGGNDSAIVSTAVFYGAIALLGSTIAARLNSRALSGLPLRFAIVLAFTVPLVWTLAFYLVRAAEYIFGIGAMIATAAWTLAVVNLVLEALKTDEPPEKIAFRKRLIAAREYFLAQLRQREPRLHDDWFPYLLAFGLGRNVDSWFRSYGGASSSDLHTSSSSFGSSSSSSGSFSSSGWSGGGGAFGGAGATGGWAVAAAALGAGVAAPSSSSSGGGGGGGGSSSSGGGGGGGW